MSNIIFLFIQSFRKCRVGNTGGTKVLGSTYKKMLPHLSTEEFRDEMSGIACSVATFINKPFSLTFNDGRLTFKKGTGVVNVVRVAEVVGVVAVANYWKYF